MAKQVQDSLTLELPGFEKPRGRPRLAYAKPGKVRTREYRLRQAAQDESRRVRLALVGDVELARYMAWPGALPDDERREAWLEFGRRNGWR